MAKTKYIPMQKEYLTTIDNLVYNLGKFSQPHICSTAQVKAVELMKEISHFLIYPKIQYHGEK